MQERQAEQEIQTLSSDSQNTILIIQGKAALEATEDKIIIQLDPFRSGYECKKCCGSGVEGWCNNCLNGRSRLNPAILCKECDGRPAQYIGKECRSCKGIGSTIVIPESAKALPTSGRIVSCGLECKKRKVGERVLFGAHTGYFLPFKGNIRLRIMREHEIMCLIYGIEKDIQLGDFMVLEEETNFRS